MCTAVSQAQTLTTDLRIRVQASWAAAAGRPQPCRSLAFSPLGDTVPPSQDLPLILRPGHHPPTPRRLCLNPCVCQGGWTSSSLSCPALAVKAAEVVRLV